MTNGTVVSIPSRLSSVYHRQSALGAKFVRDSLGWVRAESFTNPNLEMQYATNNVGCVDISHLVKISIKGNGSSATVTGLDQSGEPVQLGTVFRPGRPALQDALCAALTTDEALLLVNPSGRREVDERLALQNVTSSFHVIDVTSVLTGLCLVGPQSRAVLSKLCEIDLDPRIFGNLSATCSGLHRVQCFILRSDIAGTASYQAYFERAYGEYIWDAILHAGREYGIVPMGTAALKLMGWNWD